MRVDVVRDPEGLELANLRQHTDLDGATVLEIGSGDGRLTWQYAEFVGSVIGVDPDLDSLRTADQGRSQNPASSLSLVHAEAEHLPFTKEKFDLAILAWSL
jgi:ubiquinone/menaquinone biosynthesis C-methylase UbiE